MRKRSVSCLPLKITAMTTEVCTACDNEVTHLPPDGLSYCGECERIVEGQTRLEDDVQDALTEVGYDTLDNLSVVEAFTIGWLKGRGKQHATG